MLNDSQCHKIPSASKYDFPRWRFPPCRRGISITIRNPLADGVTCRKGTEKRRGASASVQPEHTVRSASVLLSRARTMLLSSGFSWHSAMSNPVAGSTLSRFWDAFDVTRAQRVDLSLSLFLSLVCVCLAGPDIRLETRVPTSPPLFIVPTTTCTPAKDRRLLLRLVFSDVNAIWLEAGVRMLFHLVLRPRGVEIRFPWTLEDAIVRNTRL